MSTTLEALMAKKLVSDFARACAFGPDDERIRLGDKIVSALSEALADKVRPAVAVVTECEACFTPDVCRLRSTCDHFAAERLRVASPPVAPAAPVAQVLNALVAADQFITNGIALGFIRMPDADTPDTAHNTPGIVKAAISALSKALPAPVAPQGWRLVPEQATPNMLAEVAPFPEHLRAEHPDPEDPWHRNMAAAVMADRMVAAQNYRAMLAAAPPAPAAAPAEGARWLPIESAPKDGTYFMASNKHGVWVASHQQFAASGYRFDNPWRSMMLNHWHIQPKDAQYEAATHWAPLPAAPTEAPNDQA